MYTFLVSQENSEIINSRDVSVYILEFIISIVFLGFTSRKRTKETNSTIK